MNPDRLREWAMDFLLAAACFSAGALLLCAAALAVSGTVYLVGRMFG